ncbi:MAG: carboxymuconolactone decarboxylase family protein [Methermicoccaceae archaeon]
MVVKDLLKRLEECYQNETEGLQELVVERYGEVPYIMKKMQDDPKLFVSKLLYDTAMLDNFKSLEPETVELISIAVSSAIKCRPCIDLHVRSARRMGVSDEAILASMLIAASLSNAAVLADATRSLDETQEDEKDEKDDCPECKISSFEG